MVTQKLRNRVQSNVGIRSALLTAVASAVFMVFGGLPQTEVDRIVEGEILMCEHDEDAEAIESDLKSRGATDEMLALGYFSALRRTQNAELESLDSEKFHSAAFGFAKVASSSALTNLLLIATCSTNDLNASDAILAFQGRDPSSRALLQWCVKEACRTNCQKRVHAAIWECLGKGLRRPELAKDIKMDILRVARRGVLEDLMTAFEADRILSEHDPSYRRSLLRKQVVSRVEAFKNGKVPDPVRRYFEKVKTEVEK